MSDTLTLRESLASKLRQFADLRIALDAMRDPRKYNGNVYTQLSEESIALAKEILAPADAAEKWAAAKGLLEDLAQYTYRLQDYPTNQRICDVLEVPSAWAHEQEDIERRRREQESK